MATDRELFDALFRASDALRDASRVLVERNDVELLARCKVCQEWLIDAVILETDRQRALKSR